MTRFKLPLRLALIIAGGLVIAQMLMTAAYFTDRRLNGEGVAGSMATQVGALAQLLDRLPEPDRELALDAVSGPGFRARIAPQPETGETKRPPLLERVPLLERLIRAQLGKNDPREVTVVLDTAFGGRWIPMMLSWPARELRMTVGLADGRFLLVRARGELTARLFGVPVGLVAGLLGIAVALATVLAVRRETRPISELSAALDRFGTSLEPQRVEPRGAPDVRRLAETFDAMQRRIVELVRNRSLVLGAMSHDLATYVTRLRLRIALLPEGPQTARAQRDLEEMQALLADTLDFARGSFTGRDGASIDFAALVAEECAARAAEGAPIHFSAPSVPCRVAAAPSALKRLAANLIGNAIAYGGRADVSLMRDGDAVDLVVEDRGPGVPEAERERVFEPFYRLDASRSRETGGAGLGLTIVRQITDSIGGTVGIADRPGGGARVTARLPLVAD
ncbi:signal transduction histidine kinase [Azorhizobium sp. AG788]|uniref:sensor histidine kinase n=1 Tax=Azorhizobium sp. AG788 TaxID=2183897 RepID=UPI00105CDBE5|nr:ATP-binding protein [Azorhizobium sp. AG788]TDT96828.1 signal transduction histidine kinase [Azorhizobium sp. AG788]